MTREESWQVEGETLAILRRITATGFIVSVFRFPSSLLGQHGHVEMHAMDLSKSLPHQHVARIGEDEPGDIDYRCARLLGEMVGIHWHDG